MGKINIEIKTDNASFEFNEAGETARILRELADKLEQGRNPEKLLDYNGNAVGKVIYED